MTTGSAMIRSRLKVVLAEHNVERMRSGQPAITIRQLAEAINVSPSTLTGLTTNRMRNVNYDTLDALCRYFKRAPGDFLEYSDTDEGRA